MHLPIFNQVSIVSTDRHITSFSAQFITPQSGPSNDNIAPKDFHIVLQNLLLFFSIMTSQNFMQA